MTMLNPEDIIQLSCSKDLIQAGAAQVTHSLVHPSSHSIDPAFDSLRAEVVDTAVELSFRRLLAEEKIPHDLIESLAFSQPDHSEVAFGGRRCIISGTLICQREEINRIHKNPGALAKGNIFLRETRRSSAHRDVDLYIFAFLTGLITRGRQDLQKALNASQPAHLLFPMPEAWGTPGKWEDLGPIALKGDITSPVSLTLSGQDQHRGFVQTAVELPSRQRIQVMEDFHTLNVVTVSTLPDGPVGIFSPKLKETLIVSPYKWGNVWVYGMRIFLMGYISQGDFNRQVEGMPDKLHAASDPCLDEDVIAIPASGLKPLKDLFVRAENWAQQSKS
ncbi:MAG: hypothetical protein PVF83_04580 [Anaerolineales bacterium]|jgi:hypothetical protein